MRRELRESAACEAQRAQLRRCRLYGRQCPHGAAAQIQQTQICSSWHTVCKLNGDSTKRALPETHVHYKGVSGAHLVTSRLAEHSCP